MDELKNDSLSHILTDIEKEEKENPEEEQLEFRSVLKEYARKNFVSIIQEIRNKIRYILPVTKSDIEKIRGIVSFIENKINVLLKIGTILRKETEDKRLQGIIDALTAHILFLQSIKKRISNLYSLENMVE